MFVLTKHWQILQCLLFCLFRFSKHSVLFWCLTAVSFCHFAHMQVLLACKSCSHANAYDRFLDDMIVMILTDFIEGFYCILFYSIQIVNQQSEVALRSVEAAYTCTLNRNWWKILCHVKTEQKEDFSFACTL